MNVWDKEIYHFLLNTSEDIEGAMDVLFDHMEDDENYVDNELESMLGDIQNSIQEAIDYVRDR